MPFIVVVLGCALAGAVVSLWQHERRLRWSPAKNELVMVRTFERLGMLAPPGSPSPGGTARGSAR